MFSCSFQINLGKRNEQTPKLASTHFSIENLKKETSEQNRAKKIMERTQIAIKNKICVRWRGENNREKEETDLHISGLEVDEEVIPNQKPN